MATGQLDLDQSAGHRLFCRRLATRGDLDRQELGWRGRVRMKAPRPPPRNGDRAAT